MSEAEHWIALILALLCFLWVDLRFFARGREPSLREGLLWSLGWLVVSLLAGLVLLATDSPHRAAEYTTVYLIERTLSLDNLFVFLLLFSFFAVPVELRARLLFFGIVFALMLRGLAIAGGITLIEQFHFAIYVLGALLIVLAYRILKGVDESADPNKNVVVRLVRKVFPVSDRFYGNAWFHRIDGKLHVTPLFLCLGALVTADIAFAIDSIPAALAISDDTFVVWMANVFALLGLRALFVLVEGLIKRFRYLDQTIAVVLALVGVKLLIEDVVEIGPAGSLAMVLAAFAIGIVASELADRRERHSSSSTASGSGSTSS